MATTAELTLTLFLCAIEPPSRLCPAITENAKFRFRIFAIFKLSKHDTLTYNIPIAKKDVTVDGKLVPYKELNIEVNYMLTGE